MAGIPGSKYLGKLVFKKGSTAKNIYIAKFFFGTRDNGGYYDTGGTANISNATTAAAIRTKICQEFSLDEIEAVWQNGYAKGFVGLVKDGGSLINYHDMSKRKGHKLTKNGATYYALNDAGLHVKGWGNISMNYCFTTFMDGLLRYLAPFYDGCSYTFQYSTDGTNWTTYTSASRTISAKGEATITFGTLSGISENTPAGTLYTRLVCTNDEGTINVTNNITMKAAAIWQQATRFTGSYTTHIPTTVYSGSTSGTGVGFYMMKADYDAIIAACRAYTPPVAVGHDYWARGQRVAADDAGLGTIRVKPSLPALYAGTSASYTAGWYLLTKDYGVYLNNTGLATYIFYAYEAPGTDPHIRVTASFSRTWDEAANCYRLTAVCTGEYLDASPSNPNYDTTLTLQCQWSLINGGAAAAGAYFNGGATYATGTLLVEANPSGAAMATAFFGYTDEGVTNINGCLITVTGNTSTLRWGVVYA